ncbi:MULTISPECIES: LysR family transcriptional regulator [unclassified Acinetobacter]|uniref:LysR family transcriptional regulator n=1 Tax=unclassified Acinetobacter TaxID=196816 RepID=UPI000DA6BB77|nr:MULTISPECIES: LysR family transcriptional regulator [unclassified Acinetobacter]RGD92149.1 LysR family transcriptional regulator [Acinetobacter sp. SWAC57]
MTNIHSKSPIDMGLFHRIDINLYPLFIAIYEQKSISKAAQILSITQSAASHALQRLRGHLKDDLFVRSGSQMLPTPFAEQSYPIIKSALIAIQSISIQQQSFDPNMVNSLKIAIHDEIEPIIFPKLVAHFQKLGLSIQFVSSKLDRKTVDADLVSQQIDFVIDLEQNFGERIQFNSLVKDQFVACTLLKQIDANTYLAAPHIGVSSRRTGVLVEDIYLNRKQLSRQVFLRCQHYSTALQILEQYPNAILTIPKNILTHLNISPSLNIFDVPIELPKMNIGIYWHKNLSENKRHLFLKSEIFKIFA